MVDQFAKKRAEIEAECETKLRRLNVTQDAFWKAEEIIQAWTDSAEGRQGRIYVGEGHLIVTIELAPSDIFADAEDAFEEAQTKLRYAFPSDWIGDWSEVEDQSYEHTGRRGSRLAVAPDGTHWWDRGALITLDVYASITAQSACQVVQIGVKAVKTSVQQVEMKPVYRAVCPGDPVTVAAE